jgi:hypothetical protein
MPNRDAPDGPLATVVADIASELDEVDTRSTNGGFELRRGSRLFAVVDRLAVEFRLRADVADAVLRTPDTAPSGRGNEWVRFVPVAVDPSVEDRLAAWITSAWRAAGN